MNIKFREFRSEDWVWVNAQIPILQVEDTTGIMAVDTSTGELVGACILDNWTKNSVQAHFMVSSPLVLKHGFLQECFGYVFSYSNLKYMYGLVPGDNKHAIRLNKHMGFIEKVRLDEAWAPGVDYVLMQLTKETCKYLPKEKAA
jgi:hypothetical protein